MRQFSGNAHQRRVKRRRWERGMKRASASLDVLMPAMIEGFFAPNPFYQQMIKE